MDFEGTPRSGQGHGPGHAAHKAPPSGAPVPRPSAPPPMPAKAPPASALETWLRTPRAHDAPGIYAFGHTPRPAPDPDRLPGRRLLGGAVLALLSGLLVWSLCWNGYLPFWIWPLIWLTPDDWRSGTGDAHAFAVA
ncbi:MAG TPA: ATP-binding protein, partial [Streptomyces sp.]